MRQSPRLENLERYTLCTVCRQRKKYSRRLCRITAAPGANDAYVVSPPPQEKQIEQERLRCITAAPGSHFGSSPCGSSGSVYLADLTGAKLGPISLKVDPKGDRKNDHLFDGLWMDF